VNILNLKPGIYKIRTIDRSGGPRSRSNYNTIRLLRVRGEGRDCRYYFDLSTNGMHPSLIQEVLRDFEIVSELPPNPAVLEPVITISFKDTAGVSYRHSVSDLWDLREIFQSIDWLRQPFNYVPKNKKVISKGSSMS